jgi:hypothetical protein
LQTDTAELAEIRRDTSGWNTLQPVDCHNVIRAIWTTAKSSTIARGVTLTPPQLLFGGVVGAREAPNSPVRHTSAPLDALLSPTAFAD